MFIRYFLLGLITVTYLYAYDNAISDEVVCKRIEKLSKESENFYNKFHDIKSTLLLFNGVNRAFHNKNFRTKTKCLNPKSYDMALEKYAKFLSIKGDEHRIKLLKENNPSKLYMIRYLGDVYRKAYQSKDFFYSHNRYEYREKALEQYRNFVKLGGELPSKEKDFLSSNGLDKAKDRWGIRYKIDQVPSNGFLAIYFNSKDPNKIVHQEKVPYIAAKFQYKNRSLGGNIIPAKEFGTYWVGDISFEQDTKKLISMQVVNLAEYRIILDGFELAKSKNSQVKIPILFSKGKHRLEIEYLSHYDYVDIMMSITDNNNIIKDKKDVKKILNDWDGYLFYVGAYHSMNFDSSIDISFKKHYNKPITLILNSNFSINWRLHIDENQVDTILVTGDHNKGSFVSFAKDEQKVDPNRIFRLDSFYGPRTLRQTCKCYNGKASCSGTAVSDFSQKILDWFGKSLDGYTTDKNGRDPMMVPVVFLDKQTLHIIKRRELKNRKLSAKCEKKDVVGIDNFFSQSNQSKPTL